MTKVLSLCFSAALMLQSPLALDGACWIASSVHGRMMRGLGRGGGLGRRSRRAFLTSNDASSSTSTATASQVSTEYVNLIQSLASQTRELRMSLQQMKETALQLQRLEMEYPKIATLTSAGELSSDLKAALAEAKAADNVFGPHSDQAYWKWRNVEDAVVGRLDVNCIDGELATSTSTTTSMMSTMPNVRYLQNALSQHHHDYSAVVDTASIKEVVDALGTMEHFDRLVRIEAERVKVETTA